MIESLKDVYDYIILDTAPLGLVIDGAIVAKECDGAVIVVEAGKVKYRQIQDVKKKIEGSGCNILGVVLNKVDRKGYGYYSGKYGKYGKYYGTVEEKK